MLTDLVPWLRCPVCTGDLETLGASLGCVAGHRFDIARQGYVNLLTGRAPSADTPAMVEARDTFLRQGHYAWIAEALIRQAQHLPAGPVVDVGAGTGYYLAALLEQAAGVPGLALDSSKAAARRAARCHPRAAAVVCDAWRPLPVKTGVAAAVLNVFAPRNPAEFHRVLRPGGALLVVTPTSDHLAELVAAAGLLSVDADKDARLANALDPWFDPAGRVRQERRLRLSRAQVAALIGMGPSAWHTSLDVIDTLPEPFEVTVSCVISRWVPRQRLPE